ncbi:MAG TPA: outer membrane protein assembly factor BamD [Pyrinomonadaceae bacterium]|nr:outer membrane protein assembly factor BamD [Pyrinomonadaceae bacterium]
MKVKFLFLLLLLFFVAAPSAMGQTVRNAPDQETFRDPDLERDSHHNLEVAKNYFKLKKAYVAALKRCEEIIAGNPNFAKIEEVLLMAGQSSLWLAEGKGKQNPNLYVTFDGGQKRTLTPEQFREMGRQYLNKLITDYPGSPYAKEAQEELNKIGKTKQDSQD